MRLRRTISWLLTILACVGFVVIPVFSGPPYYHEGNINYPGSYFESTYIEKGIEVDDYSTMMDFALFKMTYGIDSSNPWGVGWGLYNPDADFNGDDRISSIDFAIFANYFMLYYHDGTSDKSGGPNQNGRTKVRVDPRIHIVPVGSVFSIDIMIEDVTELWFYELKLSWDSNLMTVIDVVEGDFFGVMHGIFTGYLYVGSLQPDEYTASGSGVLATIHFKCTGTGKLPTSTIHINSGLYDIDLNSIPHKDYKSAVKQRS